MKALALAAALIWCSGTIANEAPAVLKGSWRATADPNRVLRGTWTALASPNGPNQVRGSWTLLSDTDEVLLEGTWSGRKMSRGWLGTWKARTARGQSFSGTWKADLANFDGKTFEDMFKSAATKELAGWWQSGRYQGNWWLKGRSPQGVQR